MRSVTQHVLATSRAVFPRVFAFPRRPTHRSIRDRLIESWNDTNQHFDVLDVKRVYVCVRGGLLAVSCF